MPRELTLTRLCREACAFAETESNHAEPKLFGVTDGKAVGTYLEQKFRVSLEERYSFERGIQRRESISRALDWISK
jgi:hypothetical protein